MSDEVVLSYHDSLLHRSDVELLRGTGWLNDRLIGFWFEYLEKDLFISRHSPESVCLISPEVAQFVKLGTAQDASLFLEPLDLKSKSLILLPVNDLDSLDSAGGSHWSLLVYHASDQQFYDFDSSNQSNLQSSKKIVPKLGLPVARKNAIFSVKCTQQQNSWDCGIFTCCHAELVMEHHPNSFKLLPVLDHEIARDQRNRMLKIISQLSSMKEAKW